MSTTLMARKPKRDLRTAAIVKAILGQYNCKNVEDMQDAIKDIFGPMFEAMLQGKWIPIWGTNPMTMALNLLKTAAMDTTIQP